MEIPRLSLGSVQKQQLVKLLDAARAEGTAHVAVSCGAFAVELGFDDGRVIAQTGRDASRVAESPLTLEDEAVLLILGWRRDRAGAPFDRQWHPATTSEDIAEDVLRTFEHAYQCEPNELDVLLRVTDPAPLTVA